MPLIVFVLEYFNHSYNTKELRYYVITMLQVSVFILYSVVVKRMNKQGDVMMQKMYMILNQIFQFL